MSWIAAALLVQQVATSAQGPATQNKTPPPPAVDQLTLPVQMGFRVKPDTVLIGQQFDLFIKILAPRGVRFEFPAGPDTTSRNGVRPIELRGEKLVSMMADTAAALYRLVAWDVGTQPLRFPDVRVMLEGQERRIPLGDAAVFVKSVLPADTALRIPKPARPPIALPVFNWLLWAAILAAAVALALMWWAWRRWRNRPKPPVDPYVRARQEFDRIEARQLVEKGEREEHVAAMTDVVREFIASRVAGVRRSDTTNELLRAMQPREGVETELPGLLSRADLVKFARAEVAREEAVRLGSLARVIVDGIEARLNPESEPAKRAAASRRRAA